MTLESNGSKQQPPLEILRYWIRERERVRLNKENGLSKPWSDDPIFQTTYFCNIRREDDKTSKVVNSILSRYPPDLQAYLAVACRCINWIPTLNYLDDNTDWSPESVEDHLLILDEQGVQVWGNAYVFTTSGRHMPKAKYLCSIVLPAAWERLYGIHWYYPIPGQRPTLEAAYRAIKTVPSMGSFMAGQVIADLKNVASNPLWGATDRWNWATPGPGSLRGLKWLGLSGKKTDFIPTLKQIRKDLGLGLDLQDVQNCLCEFDKYMRIYNGTGRSKRSYNGQR